MQPPFPPSAESLVRIQYPFSTLPTEIVVETFACFVPVYPRAPPLLGLESPNLLTHICHEWREIALATPVLWRAISLTFDRDASFAHEVAISHSWLQRSRALPLSIQIRIDTPAAELELFSATIIPHRQRWEYLYMHNVTQAQVTAIDGPMALLRHLALTLDVVPSDLVVVFKDAPSLRTVLLNFRSALMLALPWAQLTSLTLKHTPEPRCIAILRAAAPNLVHCSLTAVAWGDFEQSADITLPQLESLVLRVQILGASGLRSLLILPALRHLTLLERFPNPDPFPVMAAFIGKAACTLLEVVRVTETGFVSEQEYLAAFPLIPTFTLVVPSEAAKL
ncbi:hypothetical protein C8R46DRAFT_1060768 [Mycena filopes]|nr:hypothetical protein C8R46DRAFT_1060768 [Mycena filopes]